MNPARLIRSTYPRCTISDNYNYKLSLISRGHNNLSTCTGSIFNSHSWNTSNCSKFRNYSQSPHPSPQNIKTTSDYSDKDVDNDEDIAKGGIKLDMDLIQHLERTSLVDFDNEEALRRLEEAVKFANTLFEVDTTGVEPLTSVLEDVDLFLREDKVGPTSRQDILSNASLTEEDYFVAPPGNIPLESAGSLTKRNR